MTISPGPVQPWKKQVCVLQRMPSWLSAAAIAYSSLIYNSSGISFELSTAIFFRRSRVIPQAESRTDTHGTLLTEICFHRYGHGREGQRGRGTYLVLIIGTISNLEMSNTFLRPNTYSITITYDCMYKPSLKQKSKQSIDSKFKRFRFKINDGG